MALDMVLAEKGGVCVMLGGKCCTFIPNNTAPDGSITRALRGLTTLAEEIAENSGVNNEFTDWLESWFGKWKGMVVSVLTSLIIMAGILITVGCCIIPCVRGLVQRLIETTLTKKMSAVDHGERMNLLKMGNELNDEVNKIEEQMLQEFEM